MAFTPLGFRFSRGVTSTISPPITLAKKWAAAYQPTQERPLLDMSQGAPGYPPPEELQVALGKAGSSLYGFGYCPVAGELSLRQSLASEMKRSYGKDADVTADDIILSAGCNMAFIAAVMALADAGDEVILPTPWYFNHQMSLTLFGMIPVPLLTRASAGFLPSVNDCEALITSKTKAIVLVTPNNPTGAIYPPSLLLSFLNLARKHDIALILDETYRDFVLTGPPHTLFSQQGISETWRTNLIHLFSFSKSYCIPGHRLGAIVASPTLIEPIVTILDCLQICAPRPPQIALAPLLPSLRSFVLHNAVQLQERHTLFRKLLPTNWTIGSQGAYYAFVRHPFKGVSSEAVCKRLATELGVGTLPGSFFRGEEKLEDDEDDRWIRFSVANVDNEELAKVCERLVESEQAFGWQVLQTPS